MLKVTLQLVMLSGEGGGQGDTNLTTPTQHRQKSSKESKTHQTKEPDTEGLQIPFWGRSNDIYFLHKTVPQKLHQGKKKNQQHCYQGCGINSKSSNSCFSISQWLILANETWVLPPVSLLSRGMETPCNSLVSLFPAPEVACSTWYTCEPMEPHCPQHVCRLVMNVCMQVCAPSETWESVVPASDQSLFWRLERKTESVPWSRYFPGSPLPSVSSPQAAPSGLTLIPLWGLVDS